MLRSNMATRTVRLLVCGLLASHFATYYAARTAADQPTKPLTVVVMDPLSAPLCCACVNGVGQRRYEQVIAKIAEATGQPLVVLYEESLMKALPRSAHDVAIVIGQASVVKADAADTHLALLPVARLTDPSGSTTVRGAFITDKNSPIKSLAELTNQRIVLGPSENSESNSAARDLLAKQKLTERLTIDSASSFDAAAFAIDDGEAAAAVVPEYLIPLLEGCGKFEPGAFRILARAEEHPFVTAFVNEALPPKLRRQLAAALLDPIDDKEVLAKLESKHGFLAMNMADQAIGWTDFRGPGRGGQSEHLPAKLPEPLTAIWEAEVTGPALAGIAATDRFVVVADKDRALTNDIIRCFAADSGKPVWTLTYPAAKKLDYTNAPRATPVIVGDLVYTQGALGDLHCLQLATGRVVWKANILQRFNADLLDWGSSVAPLIVGDMLIVNPGAEEASLAALNRFTGETIWTTPGHAAAYSSFMVAAIGGERQIIGYDSGSLGGWDIISGKRLWDFVPPDGADFNVGTPVPHAGGLLLATENNATRLHAFADGKIVEKPLMTNIDLAPDTCTPVIVGNRLFCNAYGEMYCLDLSNDLNTIWVEQNDMFFEHCNLIAGRNRVLAWTTTAELVLLDATADSYKPVSLVKPFGDTEVETMSHPAIMPGRLYVRSDRKLLCLSLKEK